MNAGIFQPTLTTPSNAAIRSLILLKMSHLEPVVQTLLGWKSGSQGISDHFSTLTRVKLSLIFRLCGSNDEYQRFPYVNLSDLLVVFFFSLIHSFSI